MYSTNLIDHNQFVHMNTRPIYNVKRGYKLRIVEAKSGGKKFKVFLTTIQARRLNTCTLRARICKQLVVFISKKSS